MAYLFTEYGLIDLIRHFHQCIRFRNLKTWSQVRQGTLILLICHYIIGTDRRRFELVGIRDMHNFLSGHFTLMSRILCHPSPLTHLLPSDKESITVQNPRTAELRRSEAKFQILNTL